LGYEPHVVLSLEAPADVGCRDVVADDVGGLAGCPCVFGLCLEGDGFAGVADQQGEFGCGGYEVKFVFGGNEFFFSDIDGVDVVYTGEDHVLSILSEEDGLVFRIVIQLGVDYGCVLLEDGALLKLAEQAGARCGGVCRGLGLGGKHCENGAGGDPASHVSIILNGLGVVVG